MTVMVGFQWGGDVRGTVDIIWSCVLVLVTAVWTVIHVNIPAPGDGLWTTMSRRLRWGFACVFAPDMLTLVAASQWDAAARSVESMNELEQVRDHPNKWQMEHAFYANSGGFHLQCPDCRPFPVNAKSLQYLVANRYVEVPEITAEEIWDKSKADSFAKGAVLFQGAWLVTQSIAREVQGLPITPLELFTLAFVVSTAMSYFFWWRKPQNVSTNTTLACDYAVTRIRVDAGQPPDAWDQTPLDWVESEGRRWTRRKSFSHFGMGTAKTVAAAPATQAAATSTQDLEKSHSRAWTAVSPSTTLVAGQSFPLEPEPKRPVQRIANDAIMPAVLSAKVYAGLIIPSMIHSCIHLLGWNMDYPSNMERQLWRASTVALAAMSCIAVGVVRTLNLLGYKGRYTLVFVWVNVESYRAQEMQVPHGQRQAGPGGNRNSTLASFGRRCWARITAVARRVTVAEILLSLATLVLVLARLYIIVEVVISLRSQPEGVYVSLDWLSFLPHV